MPKITKRLIDALRPHERERVVWDDEIKGFGVRVHPTGKRVYIVKYRHRGRVVKTTIGPHGPIAPAEARARAAEIITAARTGRDPAAVDGRGGRGPTMAELAQRFLEEYVPAHCKPGTRTVYRSALMNHVVPRLGNRRVADVERADIAASSTASAAPRTAVTTSAVEIHRPPRRYRFIAVWACITVWYRSSGAFSANAEK